jgi:hypothetical protein
MRTAFLLTSLVIVCSTMACSTPESPSDAAQDDLTASSFSFRPRAEREENVALDNAYWMSLLAGASYASARDLPSHFRGVGIDVTEPGYEFSFFDVARTNAQAFYLGTPQAAFLVFRGTLEPWDWLTNSDKGPRRGFAPGSAVHKGYANALDSLWKDGKMREFLAARHSNGSATKPLYIAGHSMGGALAVLATYRALFHGCESVPGFAEGASVDSSASCLSSYIPFEAVYTFGQPRVGDAAFAALVAGRLAAVKAPYYRFVNADDGVPAFPEELGFVHLESTGAAGMTLVGLSRAGRALMGTDPKGLDDRGPGAPEENCGDRSGNDQASPGSRRSDASDAGQLGPDARPGAR